METPGQYEANDEGMERIQFSVPKKLLSQAREIAESEGWREAEFYRIIWMLGLNSHAESSNKRLTNKKLREQ